MDQSTLVTGGHALVKRLDVAGLRPRLAMWVHNTDTDTWRLWIVPPPGRTDKREFYRTVAQILSKDRAAFGDIDASDTEMILDTHPAMNGLKKLLRAPDLTSIHFSGNKFNGFYVPEGIILRLDL